MIIADVRKFNVNVRLMPCHVSKPWYFDSSKTLIDLVDLIVHIYLRVNL